ncbi:MAG TPA: ornithine cyclodeaminase family protein [Blastocatellia bacterium]
MLILNESDLRRLLGMNEVIQALERGFRRLGSGLVRSPERLNMPLPELGGTMLEMPAALLPASATSNNEPGNTALGTKIVSVFPENANRNLDIVQSLYVLLDPATGRPLAIMEGKFITGIRTAAASALATKYMARADSKTLVIFGAGVQAGFHIEALLESTKLQRVIVTSSTLSRAESLVNRIAARYPVEAEIGESPGQALAQADVVCTCTTSAEPLFYGDLIKPGTHINAVGAFTPHTRELDTQLISRARVIVDAEQAAGVEAGEIQIPLSEGAIQRGHVKGALADVVLGTVEGRTSADEVTVFKSCGLALEDLVTASLAFEKAGAEGVGTEAAI